MALSGFTTAEANLILSFLYRGGVYVPPASHWLALLTAAASYTTVGTEVSTSGTGYARFEFPVAGGTWTAPNSNREIMNVNPIAFPTATADWGLVTHFAIRNAAVAGTLTRFGKLSNAINILLGDQKTFDPGTFIIRLD